MAYTLLISTEELAKHLDDPAWLIADCRFVLARPDEKIEHYRRAHIPGAVYFHLNRDLSAQIIPGVTGRHPLPSPNDAARHFGFKGIGPDSQVVAYDDQGGSLSAARLWWMLRWLGYNNAAVLDGGWQKWLEEDRPVRPGDETRPPQSLPPQPYEGLWLDASTVDQIRLSPDWRVIDVRTTERYLGENEPIDPIAGHIPGALNLPYTENLSAEGTFRAAQELRAIYEPMLGNVPAEKTVFYCGSGVTSMHSILAVELAGMGQAKLYAGSWSEWITDATKPIATGVEP